jgi:hypothetical protein
MKKKIIFVDGRNTAKYEIDLREVEAMAAMCIPLKYIAHVLGISEKTLFRFKKVNPALKKALERGKGKGFTKIMQTMWKLSDKQFPAAKWIMSALYDVNEVNKGEIDLNGTMKQNISVVINKSIKNGND